MVAKTSERWLLFLLIVICSTPLAIIAYSSFFARYLADDYCVKAILDQFGFWEFITRSYTGWAGSFSSLVLQGLTPSPQAVGVPIIFVILAWVGLFSLITYKTIMFLTKSVKNIGVISLALSCVLMTELLSAFPNMHEILFWYNAVVSYIVPLALASFYILLVSRPVALSTLISLFFVSFILAGFNFTFASLQIFWLAILLLFVVQRFALRAKLLASLLGALSGLVVLISAPGNTIRADQIGSDANLIISAINSLLMSLHPVLYVISYRPLTFLSLFAISLMFAFYFGKKISKPVLATLAIVAIVVLSAAVSFFPVLYVFNTLPSARGWLAPVGIALCSIAGLGYVCGVTLRKDEQPLGYLPYRVQIIIAALALVFMLNNTLTALQVAQRQIAYAAAWDERDVYLRTLSGSTETVHVRSLRNILNFEDVTGDPTHWMNACIANYYNLSTIVADDQPPFVP